MEIPANIFTCPDDIVLEVLSYLPAQDVVQLASVNTITQRLFSKQNGFYQRLLLKMGLRSAEGAEDRFLLTYGFASWRDEYRIVSYYANKIHSNRILPWKMIANLDNEPVVEYLENVVPNHFRYNPAKNTANAFDESMGLSFQSVLPLYPLPIGSSSVAYFELEIISTNPQDVVLSIGLALERYCGVPGIARSSYAYTLDGTIYLGIDFRQLTAPSYGKGDIVGCGINFHKESIFFTKNGQVVSEHAQDHFGSKLLDLKTLHAIVSCEFVGSEWKVNFGATPFVFDILRYQQSNRQAESEQLYSAILQSHLLCYSDQETYEALINGSRGAYCGSPDSNPLPDSCKDLTSFQHLLLHSYAREEDKFDSQVVGQYGLCSFFRVIFGLLDKGIADPKIDKLLSELWVVFGLDTASENMSAEEKLDELFQETSIPHIQSIIYFIEQDKDEIVAAAFNSEKNGWALQFLAFHAVFSGTYAQVPITHFWKQIIIGYLIKDVFGLSNEYATPPYTHDHLPILVTAMFTVVLNMQRETLIRIILRKNALKADSRREYLSDAKRIFMSPKFNADAEKFLESIPLQRTAADIARSISIATALKYHNNKPTDEAFKIEAILYGLYILKLDPTCFNIASTAESDFYIEVARGLEPIATNDAIRQYLTTLQEVAIETDESLMTEAYFKDFVEPFLNVKYPGNNPKQKLLEFFEVEINKLTSGKADQDADHQKNRKLIKNEGSRSIAQSLLIGAASVGLIVTVSVVLWMRSRNKTK